MDEFYRRCQVVLVLSCASCGCWVKKPFSALDKGDTWQITDPGMQSWFQSHHAPRAECLGELSSA